MKTILLILLFLSATVAVTQTKRTYYNTVNIYEFDYDKNEYVEKVKATQDKASTVFKVKDSTMTVNYFNTKEVVTECYIIGYGKGVGGQITYYKGISNGIEIRIGEDKERIEIFVAEFVFIFRNRSGKNFML